MLLLFVEGDSVRSRLLSPREAARLMGLPGEHMLPRNVNQALHLPGDGVVAPVVRFLASHLLSRSWLTPPIGRSDNPSHRISKVHTYLKTIDWNLHAPEEYPKSSDRWRDTHDLDRLINSP